MKKTILFAVFISAILFGGCGLGDQTSSAEKNTAAPVEQDSEAKPDASVPPSLDDGKKYFDALSAKDSKLCATIKNVPLKERCAIEIAK